MSATRVEVSQGNSGIWYWRCWDCGWVGLNCGSESFAKQEASQHVCPTTDERVEPVARWLANHNTRYTMDERVNMVEQIVTHPDGSEKSRLIPNPWSGGEYPSGLADTSPYENLRWAILHGMTDWEVAEHVEGRAQVDYIEDSVRAWLSVVSEKERAAATDAVMQDYALFRHPRYGTELTRREVKEILGVALAAARGVLLPKETP